MRGSWRLRGRGFCQLFRLGSYNDTLAHKMFLRMPKATTRVYAHEWGLKAICHDALEPIKKKKCCNIFQKKLKSTVTL
jgi:hypothetical protein